MFTLFIFYVQQVFVHLDHIVFDGPYFNVFLFVYDDSLNDCQFKHLSTC